MVNDGALYYNLARMVELLPAQKRHIFQVRKQAKIADDLPVGLLSEENGIY